MPEMTIHEQSLEAGREFGRLYRIDRHSAETQEALERYIELRRQLPRDDSGHHVGYREAVTAIRGD